MLGHSWYAGAAPAKRDTERETRGMQFATDHEQMDRCDGARTSDSRRLCTHPDGGGEVASRAPR